MKSHLTTTIHQKDKLSIGATSYLFPKKMIAKLEWTHSNALQTKEQLQNPLVFGKPLNE